MWVGGGGGGTPHPLCTYTRLNLFLVWNVQTSGFFFLCGKLCIWNKWAVTAMDSCFGLIRPPQHVIAVGHLDNLKAMSQASFTTEAALSCW